MNERLQWLGVLLGLRARWWCYA